MTVTFYNLFVVPAWIFLKGHLKGVAFIVGYCRGTARQKENRKDQKDDQPVWDAVFNYPFFWLINDKYSRKDYENDKR